MCREEGRPTENQKLDALGEIANMICGNLLPKIISPQEIFYLDSPKKINGKKIFHKKQTIANVNIDIGFENGFVNVNLFFDKEKYHDKSSYC
ncbi:chemotaxis protein CheX [Candidatus Poribacteria bacterium]|nr:chemotaxis protein CheX [Candidatus Poribacteria bacterium]